jgi:hypothetical protein
MRDLLNAISLNVQSKTYKHTQSKQETSDLHIGFLPLGQNFF